MIDPFLKLVMGKNKGLRFTHVLFTGGTANIAEIRNSILSSIKSCCQKDFTTVVMDKAADKPTNALDFSLSSKNAVALGAAISSMDGGKRFKVTERANTIKDKELEDCKQEIERLKAEKELLQIRYDIIREEKRKNN